MSKFKTEEDVLDYPSVTFRPRPYYLSFGLDYDTTPLIPHVSLLFHPTTRNGQPSGEDQHWHVPLRLRDVRRLRDWLDTYIKAREAS